MKNMSFDDLFERHYAILLRVCLRRLKDEQAASDAVQETFLSAWRHINANGWPVTPLQPWLICIAVNKCVDEHRRRSRRGYSLEALFSASMLEPADREPSIEDLIVAARSLAELETAVRGLPVEIGNCLLLHSVDGMPYTEIAKLTEVPVGTVKSRIHRARTNLRKSLLSSGATDLS